MNILLAEPNELMSRVLGERLRKENMHVLLAKDGIAAEELLQSEPIDAIVVEELLPYKNGLELIKVANELDIPIIIISEADLEEKIMEAFELGASDFIDKPFSPNELVVRVKNLLKKRKNA